MAEDWRSGRRKRDAESAEDLDEEPVGGMESHDELRMRNWHSQEDGVLGTRGEKLLGRKIECL